MQGSLGGADAVRGDLVMTDSELPILIPVKLEYDKNGAKIWAIFETGERCMFADLRGWGFLTGGGSKSFPWSKAEKIQDVWGEMICQQWNEKALPQPLSPTPQTPDGLTAPTTHKFNPMKKYGWICEDCGYPSHEPLQHHR